MNTARDELLDQLLAFRAQLMLEDAIADQLYGHMDHMPAWLWGVRHTACYLLRHRWQEVPGQQVMMTRYCARCFDSQDTTLGRQMMAGERAELRYRSRRRASAGRLGTVAGTLAFDLLIGFPLSLAFKLSLWPTLVLDIVLGMVGAFVGIAVEERLRRRRQGRGA